MMKKRNKIIKKKCECCKGDIKNAFASTLYCMNCRVFLSTLMAKNSALKRDLKLLRDKYSDMKNKYFLLVQLNIKEKKKK